MEMQVPASRAKIAHSPADDTISLYTVHTHPYCESDLTPRDNEFTYLHVY